MTVNDIIRGDELMLFVDGESIGGATNHTFTITPEVNDIACKDAGIFGWKKTTKIAWEITSENLYLEGAFDSYFENLLNDTEIDVIFGRPLETSTLNTEDGLKEGESYTPNKATHTYYQGKAKITSLTLNAQSGDNATYSITLTGCGKIEKVDVQ